MAANTRPYFIIFNGQHRMVEAPSPAAAVRHVVGAAVTELKPARGGDVAAWVRAGKKIEIAGEKLQQETRDTSPASDALHGLLDQSEALILFEDWAGYDRDASTNSAEAADTCAVFARMHPTGQMDLMTFDVLRQRAPEFAWAMVAQQMNIPRSDDATYRAALEPVYETGLAQIRARLEDQPQGFGDIVQAILHHAGKLPDPDDVGEESRDNGGVLANGQ